MTYSEKTEAEIDAVAAAKVSDIQGEADDTQDVGGVSGKRLRAYLDRIDRLEDEKKGLATDIKDIYAEAKGVGFDAKTIRKLVRLRKQDVEKRREEQELLELYSAAVGLE